MTDRSGKRTTQDFDETIDRMDRSLRERAYDIVERHYNEVHKKRGEFIPGESVISHGARVYDAEEMKALVDACFDFWLTEGRFTKQFNEEFAKFLGVSYCIPTNSGSSANLLAIAALTSPKLKGKRLKAGDEVLTVACAFPATVNPIIQHNLIPVFLDVDLGTYNIQVDRIEGAISKKTKAIFLAHALGNPFPLNEVMRICKKYNLWLLEDNCDSLGSKYHGQYTGTFGHIGTSSFYPAHHITMGEGGALVTNDLLLKQVIESFREWGRDCWCEPGVDNACEKRFALQLGSLPYGYDHKFIFSHVGYNLKLTDMQAAIGTVQLKKLPQFIKARRKNWQSLYEGLKQYEDFFYLPQASEHSEPSWFGFALTVKKNAPFSRDKIVPFLESRNIRTRMFFAGNIARHPSLEGVKFRIFEDLNNTDFIMNNTFWIGVYPGITEVMTDYILKVFGEFVHQAANKR